MAGWLTSDLDRLPAGALREMHAHATAMRDLVAQHVNSGPGGLWGRLDRLASDIESARGYPYRESQQPGEEDEHALARKLAAQMNATDPVPGIDPDCEITDALTGRPLTGDERLSG